METFRWELKRAQARIRDPSRTLLASSLPLASTVQLRDIASWKKFPSPFPFPPSPYRWRVMDVFCLKGGVNIETVAVLWYPCTGISPVLSQPYEIDRVNWYVSPGKKYLRTSKRRPPKDLPLARPTRSILSTWVRLFSGQSLKTCSPCHLTRLGNFHFLFLTLHCVTLGHCLFFSAAQLARLSVQRLAFFTSQSVIASTLPLESPTKEKCYLDRFFSLRVSPWTSPALSNIYIPSMGGTDVCLLAPDGILLSQPPDL